MKRLKFIVVALVVGGVVLTAGLAFAWQTGQSADAYCNQAAGRVELVASFTNTESGGASKAMDVEALGTTKTVQPGQTADFGPTDLGPAPQSGGTVTFHLTWSDGHQGSDTRQASYDGVGECSRPDPSPSPSPSPSESPQPSPTPSPTPTPPPAQPPTPVDSEPSFTG
jgi:hypothetical protein